jgi:AsmA protein
MRALKIGALLFGAIVGLGVIAAVAVILLVDPNDYRDDIEQRVERATGRTLKIDGELHLKLFPWLALQVNDVALGNPPGYGSLPFLSVKHADVGVKLLPLLRKKIEIRRIKLEAPTVGLVSRSEADNNWKDLAESEKSHESPQESEPETKIAGVDVTKATLLYRDEEKKSTTRLANLELHTGELGGDVRTPIRTEFDYDDGSPKPSIHLALEAQVRMPKESSRIEVMDLVAKGKDVSVRAPALVLDTEAETLAPATLTVQYGELPLTVTAAGARLFSARVIAGRVSMDRVSPRKLMPSFDMKVPNTRDPAALTALALQTDYRLTEKALRFTGLDLNLDDTRARGTVSIDDLDSMAMSFNLAVDAINIDRYREPEVKVGAQKNAKPPTDLPIGALRKLKARGTLKIGHAQLADLKFDDIRVPVDATRGLIAVMPQARFFGGTYAGDITLDARPAKARLSLNEKVRGIDIGALASAAFESTRLTGRGDANAVLTGMGNTDEAIMASLKGRIAADVKQGAFSGVDLWYELRRALALAKRTTLPTPTEPPRTHFKALAGSATLANGVLRNDDLNVDMDYLKARGKGMLNITNQAVDYRLVAEIYKLPAEGAGAEMADLKALEIPIAITGTLAAMTVRPDVADLLKARLRKEVDKKVDKKKEELKKKLGDKLKDILGR